MGREKRKSEKRNKQFYHNPNEPVILKPNPDLFDIEEKVYYQDLHSLNHDWRTGIIRGLMVQRKGHIIFEVEDCTTHAKYPINKNVVEKYGKCRPKSKKSRSKEDKKHPNYGQVQQECDSWNEETGA